MATGICEKIGCPLPKWADARTRTVHAYCGRTHAIECRGKINPPHGSCQICNLNGCNRQVSFDQNTGRVHDFCSRAHAQRAIEDGYWPKPASMRRRLINGGNNINVCSLQGCNIPCFVDQTTGRVYDFCGRSHAIEYKSTGLRKFSSNDHFDYAPPVTSNSSSVRPSTATAPVKKEIPWSSNLTNQQTVHSNVVIRSQLQHVIKSEVTSNSTSSNGTITDTTLRKSATNLSVHFCVICQQHNADVAMLPCGHICLCSADLAISLSGDNKLKNCPLCKANIDETCKI